MADDIKIQPAPAYRPTIAVPEKPKFRPGSLEDRMQKEQGAQESDWARGIAQGQERFAEGSLGRIGGSKEMQDILARRKAQAEGFRVGGKTGTAHKLVGKGYGNKYRAYFVGLAPISAPRIVVAVMIDEPTGGSHYGGDVAAPVFSTIVSETLNNLNVLPDNKVKQMVLQDKNPEEIRTANVQTQQVVLKR